MTNDHRSGYRRVLRGIVVWGPAVAVMAAIFAASSIQNLSRMPADLSDKLMHFLAYAVLGISALHGFAGGRLTVATGRHAVRAWGLAALYGASDELHQSFVPGRTMAFDDWLADCAGAAVAAGAVLLVRRLVAHDRTV